MAKLVQTKVQLDVTLSSTSLDRFKKNAERIECTKKKPEFKFLKFFELYMKLLRTGVFDMQGKKTDPSFLEHWLDIASRELKAPPKEIDAIFMMHVRNAEITRRDDAIAIEGRDYMDNYDYMIRNPPSDDDGTFRDISNLCFRSLTNWKKPYGLIISLQPIILMEHKFTETGVKRAEGRLEYITLVKS